jgi:hypothetical protein
MLNNTPVSGATLIAKLHPIVRVICDKEGIICYERLGAPSIMLKPGNPSGSRSEAQLRCIAMLESLPSRRPELRFTKISSTVEGITYEELRLQTIAACDQSLRISASSGEKKTRKRRGRGY